jgi:hypothetical protein
VTLSRIWLKCVAARPLREDEALSRRTGRGDKKPDGASLIWSWNSLALYRTGCYTSALFP